MQDQVPTATLPPFASAERVDLVFVLDGRTLVHPLPAAGRVRIGRSVPEGVTVAHASLSRSHAAITTPALTVEDLGSTNGTWLRRTDPDGTVHETAVREPVTLRPGDTLRLGAVSLVLVPSFVGGHTTSPAGDGSPSLDPAMREVHALLARVAPSDIPVLILGETGVGKEVLAERLHAASRRHAKPLLRVNCAALSEQLVESELFGHERGAFTGAVTAKPGLLEAAHGGTVLLDEIGDLRLESQAKLLRVLEEAKVLRVGGVTARAVDVRFVAATHKDLLDAVRAGRFRQDLYYRLAGVVLRVPPLRERPAERLPLAEAFLRAASERAGRSLPVLSDDARDFLASHPWPGNIRELRHSVERAVLLCDGDVIRRVHLAGEVTRPEAPVETAGSGGKSAEGEQRARIEAALERHAGNQTRAAADLGVSRRTLVTWIERHGIARPRGGRRG
jgi:two-component system response regulator AtoC